MNTLLDLKQLGIRLQKVDTMLMQLLKRRIDLALQVAEFKRKNNQKTIRLAIENKRIAQVRKWARKHKMNPHFVEAVLYLAIGESCKQQMMLLQNMSKRWRSKDKNPDEWYAELKKNLLGLTKLWSVSYDDHYDKAFFATHSYLEFEENLLQKEIEKLRDKEVLLDLGCATGRFGLKFADEFERIVGYDISPHMIKMAEEKAKKLGIKNTDFKVFDIEDKIPEPDASVSCVVMNLGTASDIRNIQHVLTEIKRVLKSRGRFFLSFYNSDALFYKWDFLPWPAGLAAEINTTKHCLDVHTENKVLSVYARAYTTLQATELVEKAGSISAVLTYPTISSILPNDLFEGQQEVQKSITEIDYGLAKSNAGAYIVVTGQKVS